MSAFKIKQDRTKHIIQINTLDETHKKYMNNFQQRRNLLPKKKKRIEKLKKELSQLENIKTVYTLDEIKKRADCKSEIKTLEEEIFDIENDLSELEYYCKTEDIIMDYYELTETDDNVLYDNNPDLCMKKVTEPTNEQIDKLDILNKINKEKKKVKKAVNRRKKRMIASNQPSILDFLTQSVSNNNNETLSEVSESEKMTNSESNEIQIMDTIQVKSKTQLLDQYMMIIDSEYIYDKKKNTSKIKKCEKCNIEKTLDHAQGIYFCSGCAEFDIVIIDSEKPNYKEAVSDTKPGYPLIFASKKCMRCMLRAQGSYIASLVIASLMWG